MIKNFLIIFLLFILMMHSGCKKDNPIVYSRLTNEYWQIWTMQSNGQDAEQITYSPRDKRYPVWSATDLNILYRDNDNQPYIINLENNEESRILESFGRVGRVVPSPDGKEFLFVRFRSELKDSSDLWIISRDGENQRLLTRDVGLQYDPVWSPDGKKVAYISGHGYQTHELFMIDSDGKSKRQLTDNKALELLPAFSPDGTKIAYVSNQTGNFEIWTMNSDGTQATQLTYSKDMDTRPSWSPDASQILFVSNRTGLLQIWIMDCNGNNPKQITKGSPSNDPDWRREFR